MKNSKLKIIIPIIIIILIIVAILVYIIVDNKKKEYNLVEISNYNYFLLNIDNKYGVIDNSGNIVVEAIYDSVVIPNPEKDVFICTSGEENIILNKFGQELFTQYEEVKAIKINGIVSNVPYEKVVLKYKENDKYGIINYEGKKITDAIYDEIESLENKESQLLVKQNEKYGVINSKGARLVEIQYDTIGADGYYTDEDKYALSGYIIGTKTDEGYRYGYINYKYKLVLDTQYNSVERILDTQNTNIYLIACKNGQYGVVRNGELIINYAYQNIEYDTDNKIFILERSDKYGVADYNGKELISIEYSEISINGIYIEASKDEEYIYFDNTGARVENNYTSMMKTSNSDYYINIDAVGLYGIVNADNTVLVENTYNYIEYLFDKYFIVSNKAGYLGVIDINNNLVIDFKYEVLQKIEDTNVLEAKILKENKTELYSSDLEKVYSIKNAYVSKEDDYIKIYTSNENFYLDFNGKKLENKEIFTNNKLIAAKNDGKWGFIDKQGNVIVDYKYDKVTEFNEYGYAGIMQDGKWGIIFKDGTIIQEPVYEITQTNSDPEFLANYYKVYYGYGEVYYTNKI